MTGIPETQTPAQWAVQAVSPPWLAALVRRSADDDEARGHVRRWLGNAGLSTGTGYVRADERGLRFSAPTGEVGRVSWDEAVAILRGDEDGALW